MSDCLTEEEVLAHMAGQGEGDALLAHVDVCPRCRGLVACAAENGDSSIWHPSTAGPRETTLKIGAIVADRYEIRRLLGRGGMGEVYEARDTELGDLVALKTLALTTLDDATAESRLKAEVLLARRVAHPNVCRIFDFAVHERRRPGGDTERIPFLTMELLSGETLGQRLRQQGRMDSPEARTIVDQIARGLAEVHRVGIVHRDLKSENVFLAKSEVGERAVLMDFGLARTAPPPGLASVSLIHGLVGTVAYMSPEQIMHKPLGPQSDIYALGVVMYEIVTGRLPFTGATAFEVALAQMRNLPASPPTVNPNVPRAWARTIMKCLAIAPEARFQQATEVLVALDTRRLRHSTRRWFAIGSTIAAVAMGAIFIWLYALQRRGSVDASATSKVAPAAPAPVVQPVGGLQRLPEDRERPVPDKLVAPLVERETPPRALLPVALGSRPHTARGAPPRPHVKPRAAEITPAPPSPALPPPESPATNRPPLAGSDPGAGKQAGKGDVRPATSPADQIVNPFVRKGSVP